MPMFAAVSPPLLLLAAVVVGWLVLLPLPLLDATTGLVFATLVGVVVAVLLAGLFAATAVLVVPVVPVLAVEPVVPAVAVLAALACLAPAPVLLTEAVVLFADLVPSVVPAGPPRVPLL